MKNRHTGTHLGHRRGPESKKWILYLYYFRYGDSLPPLLIYSYRGFETHPLLRSTSDFHLLDLDQEGFVCTVVTKSGSLRLSVRSFSIPPRRDGGGRHGVKEFLNGLRMTELG